MTAASRTFLRYLLFQTPGWILLALVLAGLARWTAIPHWLLGAGAAAFLAKDLVLYPWLRHAYEKGDHEPGEDLVGARGVVVSPLEPVGWVRVRAELWKAESDDGSLPAGCPVRVRGLDGHLLVVAAETTATAGTPGRAQAGPD